MDELQLLEEPNELKVNPAYDFQHQLSTLTDDIISSSEDPDVYTHVDFEPIPSVESVVGILNLLRTIIFPGYFDKERLNPVSLKFSIGQSVSRAFEMLSEQISSSIRHNCLSWHEECGDCTELGRQSAITLLKSLPAIRRTLAKDVRATFNGDPAAKSYDEIIFSYPGIQAIMIYRIAHRLYELDIPILPRTMTEHAHSITGIDIHPGATIGEHFVIDHGTGVVIGETTVIGNHVRIYQGVTLGALSLPTGAGSLLKDVKRHPTIEDSVIIYAGATILGGETVIGADSVIGGNVWITEPVSQGTKVMMKIPKLMYN